MRRTGLNGAFNFQAAAAKRVNSKRRGRNHGQVSAVALALPMPVTVFLEGFAQGYEFSVADSGSVQLTVGAGVAVVLAFVAATAFAATVF